ncbi:MAG: hypothetical protein U0869_21890 [Chloroflexota bacterium]
MPTDPIRTWTVQGSWTVQGWRFVPPILVDGGRLRPGERVRVADAVAVAAALGDLMALVRSQRLTPFQLCVEIDRLREAVSGE